MKASYRLLGLILVTLLLAMGCQEGGSGGDDSLGSQVAALLEKATQMVTGPEGLPETIAAELDLDSLAAGLKGPRPEMGRGEFPCLPWPGERPQPIGEVVYGKVTAVGDSSITVVTPAGEEETILINEKTLFFLAPDMAGLPFEDIEEAIPWGEDMPFTSPELSEMNPEDMGEKILSRDETGFTAPEMATGTLEDVKVGGWILAWGSREEGGKLVAKVVVVLGEVRRPPIFEGIPELDEEKFEGIFKESPGLGKERPGNLPKSPSGLRERLRDNSVWPGSSGFFSRER